MTDRPEQPNRPARPARKEPAPRIYELNVKLMDTQPPVWRRLDVPGNMTFARLHEVLRIAMGWTGQHPHFFRVGKRHLGPVQKLDDPHLLNERKNKLQDHVRKPQSIFHYVYDPENEWTHEIFVEQIRAPGADDPVIPVCLDGKRAAPPEDVEGAIGYQELLAVLADPDDPHHQERRTQVGPDFDPDAFDVDSVNAALAHST